MRWCLLAMMTLSGSLGGGGDDTFVAARYIGGAVPAAPVLAVSGGEVFLELIVSGQGRVDSIRTLRTTPPFTDAVIGALRRWRFSPALAAGRPVVSSVFVAAMFTPPALGGPTLGQPPRDVASASEAAPLVITATPAIYPPRAEGTGTVVVEVTIAAADMVTGAHVVMPSPGFDAAALTAARSWQFANARRNASVVTTHAYLLFGFQPPVVGR
jgi:TonB family protein